MSKRTRRAPRESAETPKQAAAPALRVDTPGTSPVPLVILAFGVPLLLLIIGMVLMSH